MKFVGIVFAVFVFSSAAVGKHNSDHPLSPEDWYEVMNKVVLLEDSGLMPTLLPIILRNRDALQLTDQQISAFQAWRKENYTNMVNLMNQIIEKMVQFRVDSLSPQVSAEQLLANQSQIQDLQWELLRIQLSCRELIMTTFTDEQWDNFAFVISDYPKLASLMLQNSR